jgi:2,5-diketo-D-gluconate reductase B
MDLPQIGLGTWELWGDECTKVVKLALELGYQHIDTAHVYQNHQAIKKAIKGFDRKTLYITSKIALQEQVRAIKPKDSVKKACDLALKELGIDYLDLYLIHRPDPNFPWEEIFMAMEDLVEKGKIIKAGVSNYNIHHLKDLCKAGCIPFANQVEFHPYLYQKELLDYCHCHRIKLISFRPFGKGKLLREEPLFNSIGKKYDKTAAQVILRWLIEKDIPVIPKASSKKHLLENLEIFDFSLTKTEMRQLDNLHKNKRYCRPDDSIYTY